MPRAADANAVSEPAIRYALAQVPRHIANCIGQSRRTKLPRPGPLIICQTFVINAGTTIRAAAWAGGTAKLRTARTITESQSGVMRRSDSGLGDSSARRTGVDRSHDRRGRHSAALGRGRFEARRAGAAIICGG